MFTVTLEASRVNAGLSQSQLAEILGVNRATVRNWETGKGSIPATALKKLSELSGIPMDFIFVPERVN